jgi:SAM-dependent methyltransferase
MSQQKILLSPCSTPHNSKRNFVPTDLAKRIADEKAFHNERFSSHFSAPPASRYYLALEIWYRDYLSRINDMAAQSVLEIGSGTESLALQLDSADFEFSSIDISEEAIAFARTKARLPQAKFSVQDAHRTNFTSESFDLLIGRGVLHHLDIDLACSEMKRVIKPGGRIVFGEPLDCNVLINLYRKCTPKIRSADEEPLSMRVIRRLQDRFGKLNIKYYGFLTLAPAVFGLKSPKFLHYLDGILLNRLGLGRFLAWACIISSP